VKQLCGRLGTGIILGDLIRSTRARTGIPNWLDEEPDEEVYTEALMRTMTTNGVLLLTF